MDHQGSLSGGTVVVAAATATATNKPRVAQTISLIAAAMEVRFRSEDSQWGIRDGQDDIETGFSELFGFPQSLSLRQFSSLTFHSPTTDPIQPNLRTTTTTTIQIFKTPNKSADQPVGSSGVALRLVLVRSPVRSALTGQIFYVVYLRYSRMMPRY